MKDHSLVRCSVFGVRWKILLRAKSYELRAGFTLLEMLLGFTIFTIVMTLVLVTVTGSFKSLRQAERFMLKEQKQRLCFYHLEQEVASFTRIDFPKMRFEGESASFFLFMLKRITWLKSDMCITRLSLPLSATMKNLRIITRIPIKRRLYV